MNRLLSAAFVILLVAGVTPLLPSAYAQGTPVVSVNSQYIINRYGYAIINETVKVTNNGTSSMQVPDMQFGFGEVSQLVRAYNVTGRGYSVTQASGGQEQAFVVSGGGQTLVAGNSSTFSFRVLVDNIVSKTRNGTLGLLLVTRPSLSFHADSLKLTIRMPASTQLKSSPPNYRESYTGVNVTYFQVLANAFPQPALTQVSLVQQSTLQDFHPLVVYSASRQVAVSASGNPVVRDTISFKNMGTTQLSTLTVTPLTSANAKITVLPSASPPLLSPATVSLSNRGIDLSNTAIGLPVDADANLTITYQYPLAQKFFSVSGGTVDITIPTTPPIAAFVGTYAIGMALPPGVRAVQGTSQTVSDVNPFQSGKTHLSYSLSVGWALDGAVPASSFLFALLLVGLFALRTGMGAEAEEEETATEGVTDMIKAFEEKTSLINGLFEEIPEAEPSQMGRAYFDELRGRLDAFRGRALQRLNEIKQMSTTQKFSELLGQIHETEREVDRAAKDLLNLYEQFYTKRMRREVFDRLLPSYRRRLEKALNQLSDELNVAQRESKLL